MFVNETIHTASYWLPGSDRQGSSAVAGLSPRLCPFAGGFASRP